MRFAVGFMLLCTAIAQSADVPKIILITLVEERTKFAGEKNPYPFQSLTPSIRIEGGKDIRSYGNIKITEAKSDTGVDLIRHPRRPGDFYYTTDVPRFTALHDYQVKNARIDFPISLMVAPRQAKKFKFKGSVDLLIGGEITNVDIPNILAMKDKEVVKHEEFAAAGLILSMIKDSRSKSGRVVSYAMEGKNGIVKEIEVIDATGKVIKTTNTYYRTTKGGTSHYRSSSMTIPKDAKLRVTIYKGGKIQTLPFEFDFIELP